MGTLIISCSLKNEKESQVERKETLDIKRILTFTKNPQTLAVLFGIALYGAGCGIFMTIIPAFLLIVKQHDQTYINLFFSIFYIAISLSQVFTGWLSDRLGRQSFMLTGMIVAAAGLGAAVYFDHLALTIILGVSSFGLGTYYLASMAFLNEKAPASFRGAISGVYYLFWGIGMFWGPLNLGYYIQSNSYQEGFHAFSLMLIIQAILLLITWLNWFRPSREMS
jgi:MFS family permease